MIFVGIDDTDTLDGPGTNQLARRLAARLPAGFGVEVVLRHQLLVDPRIPYTSHNGSASLLVHAQPGRAAGELTEPLAAEMRAWFQEGSDPGLCIAPAVPDELRAWGRRCQAEVVTQEEARALATRHGIYLRGLGGTEGGVVGALAAVGLLAAGDDGRVVHLAGWPWPDELRGVQPLEAVRARGVARVIDQALGTTVAEGLVDLGKHLRPAWRQGEAVLFVERVGQGEWKALKLP